MPSTWECMSDAFSSVIKPREKVTYCENADGPQIVKIPAGTAEPKKK